jgi:predicted ArsR family transcriptional regulator
VSSRLASGRSDPEVEGQILGLLAEGALAREQIAASLGADEGEVRDDLEAREQGFVERSAIAHYPPEVSRTSVHWRLTDAGRARLEQLRAEDQ